MRWARHVASVEDSRCAYRVLVGKPEGKRNLEDLDVDTRIILKWVFKKWAGWPWTGIIWIRIETKTVGCCECNN
jgi:hypothetical protein